MIITKIILPFWHALCCETSSFWFLPFVAGTQTALTMGAILESGYANLRHNPGQNRGVPALVHCEIERVKVWGLESKWIAVSRETHPRCGQQAHHVIEVNACKRIGCLVVAIAFNNNFLPYRYTNTSCAFSLYSQRQHSPASHHSRSLAVMVRFIIVCEPTRKSDVTARSHFKRFIIIIFYYSPTTSVVGEKQ